MSSKQLSVVVLCISYIHFFSLLRVVKAVAFFSHYEVLEKNIERKCYRDPGLVYLISFNAQRTGNSLLIYTLKGASMHLVDRFILENGIYQNNLANY